MTSTRPNRHANKNDPRKTKILCISFLLFSVPKKKKARSVVRTKQAFSLLHKPSTASNQLRVSKLVNPAQPPPGVYLGFLAFSSSFQFTTKDSRFSCSLPINTTTPTV